MVRAIRPGGYGVIVSSTLKPESQAGPTVTFCAHKSDLEDGLQKQPDHANSCFTNQQNCKCQQPH